MSGLSIESILSLMRSVKLNSKEYNDLPEKLDINVRDLLKGAKVKKEIYVEVYLEIIGDLSRIIEGEELSFEKNRFRMQIRK